MNMKIISKLFNVEENEIRRKYYFMGHKFLSLRNFNDRNLKSLMLTNSIMKMHSNSFDKYKGVNTGKDVYLIATGSTLADFIPPRKNNAVFVGVNKAFMYDKIKLDFLFIQDFGTKGYIYNLLSEKYSKIVKFLGIILNDDLFIPESLALKLNANRYYTSTLFKSHRFEYDISTYPLGDFLSVVFPAMQFILWTNPDKIYLVGCDCSSGYFDDKKNSHSLTHLIKNWIELKTFAKKYYPETKIFSINPVGLKGIFSDIFYK